MPPEFPFHPHRIEWPILHLAALLKIHLERLPLFMQQNWIGAQNYHNFRLFFPLLFMLHGIRYLLVCDDAVVLTSSLLHTEWIFSRRNQLKTIIFITDKSVLTNFVAIGSCHLQINSVNCHLYVRTAFVCESARVSAVRLSYQRIQIEQFFWFIIIIVHHNFGNIFLLVFVVLEPDVGLLCKFPALFALHNSIFATPSLGGKIQVRLFLSRD